MEIGRRSMVAGLLSSGACSAIQRADVTSRPVEIISAPSNLGLRPNEDGSEQGAWLAPEALSEAGLATAVRAKAERSLGRPPYDHHAQPGTRIRNGRTLRSYSLELAHAVEQSLGMGCFPLVVGGDCSVLLGPLLGARRAGCRGLVHVDGHSDFFHPGNYDTTARLGSAAGMDLALVTGRGESLLTVWPGIEGPLAADKDTIQVGDRDALDPANAAFYAEMAATTITRLIIQDVLGMGVAAAGRAIQRRLERQRIDRAWLHVDFDILDASVMPAVDSPGSPGLTFDQLSELMAVLLATGRIAGADVAIYDPGRDPDRTYAALVVKALGKAFSG